MRRILFACLGVAIAQGAAPQASAQTALSDGKVRIGVLNDASGPYMDLAGPGSVLAARMAAEDFGSKVLGAPIEIVSADHQNKPDVGSTIARLWFDEQGIDAITDVPTSSVALAVQEVVRDKKKVFLISGAATAALTGKSCSPYSIQTSEDTRALGAGTAGAVLRGGADSWFFLTADYAFGHQMEADSTRVILAGGGKIAGSVRHPQNTPDFSSFLLQAQASGAKAIGLANAGNDTVNAIRQAVEFGLTQEGRKLVGLILHISDVHALGLDKAHGLQLVEGFYWDMNDESRAFAKRFHAQFGKMPTREQATTYATVLHYLRAIEAAKTDRAEDVMKAMKAMPMKFFGEEGPIREDGRWMHDLRLYEVKKPNESKYPWDYYKLVTTIPAEDAFTPLSESECPYVKKP
ncbi:ABC transporter substrate-binding protein [Enterovirga sp. CN4-39]|uniref:ABC transporter substrate-binding protein n=1 Tax=Enterovirga sp. CN4-39 TaxID=3400910 RepID=UPI003C0C9C2E